jgi:hypothetical protein
MKKMGCFWRENEKKCAVFGEKLVKERKNDWFEMGESQFFNKYGIFFSKNGPNLDFLCRFLAFF